MPSLSLIFSEFLLLFPNTINIYLGSIGTAKTSPYPYRVPRGYGYCRATAACVHPAYPFFAKKKKFPVRVWYRSCTGQVGSGIGRDKTEPKRHRFRVNLKPILSSSPDSQPLVLFSATPFSLFSTLDSLSSLLSILFVSHFLTPPPVHSILSFSLPYSTGDGRRYGRGFEGLQRAGDPRTSI
jgi:hypothetical protein